MSVLFLVGQQHKNTHIITTMPFMLVHAGKYGTEDKLKIQTIHKPSTT